MYQYKYIPVDTRPAAASCQTPGNTGSLSTHTPQKAGGMWDFSR